MIEFIDFMIAFAITYNATPGKHQTLEKFTGVVSYSVFYNKTSESLDPVYFYDT